MKHTNVVYSTLKCNTPRLQSMEPVGSYPFNPNDMDDYLNGAMPVPSGASNREFNNIPIDEVSYYARDNFEAIEALKSAINNAHAEIESNKKPSDGSSNAND